MLKIGQPFIARWEEETNSGGIKIKLLKILLVIGLLTGTLVAPCYANSDKIDALLVAGAMDKKTAANVMDQYNNMTPVFEEANWNVTISSVSRHESNGSLFDAAAIVRSEIKKLKPRVVIGYSGGGPIVLSATNNSSGNTSVRLIPLLDSTNNGIPRPASVYYLHLDPSWPSVDQWEHNSSFMITAVVNLSQYDYIAFNSDFAAQANAMAASQNLDPIITDIPGVPKKMFHTSHAGLISDPAIVKQELDACRAMLNSSSSPFS